MLRFRWASPLLHTGCFNRELCRRRQRTCWSPEWVVVMECVYGLRVGLVMCVVCCWLLQPLQRLQVVYGLSDNTSEAYGQRPHANLVELLHVTHNVHGCQASFQHYPHTLRGLMKGNAPFLRSPLVPLQPKDSADTMTVNQSSMRAEQLEDSRVRFIVYQLVHGLQYLHSKVCVIRVACLHARSEASPHAYPGLISPQGVAHGALSPACVFLNSRAWVHLGCVSLTPRAVPVPPPMPTRSLLDRWMEGEVSNFEYLMALNAAAGRYMHDPVNHPVRGSWRGRFHGVWRETWE